MNEGTSTPEGEGNVSRSDLEQVSGGWAWVVPALAWARRAWGVISTIGRGQSQPQPVPMAPTPQQIPDERTYQPWNFPEYWERAGSSDTSRSSLSGSISVGSSSSS